MFFSCAQEELSSTSTLNEDGLEVPNFEQIPLVLETRGDLPYFEDPFALKEAIEFTDAYHEPEIAAWCKALPVKVLYSLGASYSDGEISQLPTHVINNFCGLNSDGEIDPNFAVSTMGRFVSEDGLMQMGDRIVFVSNDYQISTSLDRLDEIRATIKSGGDLTKFDVNSDRTNNSISFNDGLESRADIVSIFDNCGTGVVSTSTVSSVKHPNAGGTRQHSMSLKFVQFYNPQNTIYGQTDGPGQEWAWQALELRSVSYKKRNNQYKTRHNLSWHFRVQQDANPSIGRTYSATKNGMWGKDITRKLFITNLPGTGDVNKSGTIKYSLMDVYPGAGDVGTWGTHRGMGDNYKVRWECTSM